MREYIALTDLSHRPAPGKPSRRIAQGEVFSDIDPELAQELIEHGIIAVNGEAEPAAEMEIEDVDPAEIEKITGEITAAAEETGEAEPAKPKKRGKK